MGKQSKAYSILLYIIWPFSAIMIGVKNFDSAFGRRLLLAAFVYLGYTAEDVGDLERYAQGYYEATNRSLNELFDLFLNLQIGKLFTDFSAIILSGFGSHHVYFAFLFGFYGFFLINSINLIRVRILKESGFSVIIGFIAFATFYSVLAVFNYAFYTGAIYFLYFLLQIILNEKNKKYYGLILLTPIFHIGLIPLLLIPFFYRIFRQRTKPYIIVLFLFTALSQTFFIKNIETLLLGTETVLENKYNAYASEEGLERMDNRYKEGYESGNFYYRIFRDIRRIANNFAIPAMLFLMFINRKKFKEDNGLLDLFNISIACLAITNLMLNISQGERFFLISGFVILATFVYYIQKNNYKDLKYKNLLYFIIPSVLLNNIVSLYLVKNLVSSDFIFSNLPYLIFQLL